MKQNQLAAAFAFAATVLAGGAAFAAAPTTAEYYPFQEATLVKTIGTNSGAVSTTNSNTTKMGAQGGGVTTNDQSRQILMYLKAGA